MRRGSWMLIYGIGLYIIVGIILVFSPDAMGITSMGQFRRMNVDHALIGTVFILSGILTSCSLLIKNFILAISFCFPHQILLIISSISCLTAIFTSQYADGVKRPVMFILADQTPFILAAILHMIALIDIFLTSGVKKDEKIVILAEE